MRNLLILALTVLFFSNCKQHPSYDRTKVINELIGDESYEAMYGKLPDKHTPDNERIKAHLAYAEQLLRQKDDIHLNATQKANRKHILNLLHKYMLAGDYPKNYDIKDERRPCFLDEDGNICAVGYLVEQTHSLALACKINSVYKYSWVSDMDMPELNDWIAQSGLTKEEFSIIQPSYEYKDHPYVKSSTAGTVIGGLLGVPSITTIPFNIVSSFRGTRNNVAPIVGMSFGAAETTWGVALLLKNNGKELYINHGRFHTVAGSVAILAGTANLFLGKKLPKHDKLSINTTAFCTPQQTFIPGIQLTYKF